jgi:hypothetical protein
MGGIFDHSLLYRIDEIEIQVFEYSSKKYEENDRNRTRKKEIIISIG